MNWLKRNWLWLIINIIAILPLLGVFSLFNVEFNEKVIPNITIEQPSFPERETDSSVGEIAANEGAEPEERSSLSFPIHSTGEWAIRWLIFSLTCTPLYILLGWRKVLTVKKALGLYAFAYGVLHLLFFAADRGWLAVFDEFNFILGLISLLIMVLLALTSNQWSMNFMGKNWKLLHRAAYAAGLLAVLHVVFLGEGSWLPYAILLIGGFMLRIPYIRQGVTNFRRYIFKPGSFQTNPLGH
jgi:sulfoxide reductase heme-binding subunit YedZ